MATPERKGLLKDDSPMSASLTVTPSPAQQFSARHRPGYARVPSVSFNDEALTRDITETPGNDVAPTPPSEGVGRSHGLGIAMPSGSAPRTPRMSSPLSNYDSSSQARAGADDRRSMASPPSTGGLSGSTRADTSFGELDTAYRGAKHKDSRTSLQSTLPPSLYARSEAGLLSVKSRYEDFEPHHNCQSARSVKHGRFGNCVSVTIFIFALFSTAFSLIFLILALLGPTFRGIRSEGGPLTPGTAAFITSLFARLIELSFVSVVIAFIGQALARRAFKLENRRGVTLAEMSMRTWVMQPGTVFTQWESVKYAGVTLLGAISLLAALLALLYTSAATALVQPQLKFPDWTHQEMQGIVSMSFANSEAVKHGCSNPNVLNYGDGPAATEDELLTCLQIEHAAMSYHNYHSWLEIWTEELGKGNGSSLLAKRPPGYALYTDNTTIVAPWIERNDVTTVNETRYVNNVTMAMPHVGVIQAAQDPINRIVQPAEVEGATYNIRAAVPSPKINVLCVTMDNNDLAPFVYELWPDRDMTVDLNDTKWNLNIDVKNRTPYLNGTQFDNTFGWGPDKGTLKVPPLFPKLPPAYNILLNDTASPVVWGRTALYVLARGGPTDSVGTPMNDSDGTVRNYAMCQLQVGTTPHCSTSYNASVSGGAMEAHCEDKDDDMRYLLHADADDAIDGNVTLSADWPNIGSEWARSVSFNDGMRNGNSANARTLTQFIVTTPEISTGLPSFAEAIAVQAGNTLIQSIKGAPFAGRHWNYTLPTVDNVPQWFKATVRGQQYASGGSQPYQKAFFIVLFGVFFMNVIMLCYFLWHRDWYTDLSEPNTMFALAVNSPPTDKLAGSCGCGPIGEQYALHWKLNNDEGHYYVEPQEPVDRGMVSVDSPRLSRQRWTETFEMMGSPAASLKQRFSR